MEPLYNGQIGDWPFVPCREVVPFSEVIIVSLLYHNINFIGVNTVPGKAIEVHFCEGIPIIQIRVLFGEIMSWLLAKMNC